MQNGKPGEIGKFFTYFSHPRIDLQMKNQLLLNNITVLSMIQNKCKNALQKADIVNDYYFSYFFAWLLSPKNTSYFNCK